RAAIRGFVWTLQPRHFEPPPRAAHLRESPNHRVPSQLNPERDHCSNYLGVFGSLVELKRSAAANCWRRGRVCIACSRNSSLMILGPVSAREHPLLKPRLLHRSFSRGDPGHPWHVDVGEDENERYA